MDQNFEIFDWARILLNNWKPNYLFEVTFRTFIMFLSVLTILRLAGKRGLKQLSIFELAIIIALGSAAGDPMIYPDSPIIPAILNFILVLSIYKIITWLAGRSRIFEDFFEGKCLCILENGKIINKHLGVFGYDEFLSELRTLQVTHLGQVEKVYLETSGELSVYFFTDEEVSPGLPIQPEYYAKSLKTIDKPGKYSCLSCGNTLFLTETLIAKCSNCTSNQWLQSINGLRVT